MVAARKKTESGDVPAKIGDLCLVPSQTSDGKGGTVPTWSFSKVTGISRLKRVMRHTNPGMSGRHFKGEVAGLMLVEQERLGGFTADQVLERLPRAYPQHPWMKDYVTPAEAAADLRIALGLSSAAGGQNPPTTE